MKGLKRFEIETKELSQKEKALFGKLTSAAELIAPLYSKQKNNKYPGANFFPHNATKEEIKKANKKNPAILDPYTFIERDKSGKLIAVPFHIKFKKRATGGNGTIFNGFSGARASFLLVFSILIIE